MRAYRLDPLNDGDLLRALATLVVQERTTTAALLAHIAEVDARRLYLPAGFPSMYELCGASHRANYAEIGTMRSWLPRSVYRSSLDGLREPPTSVHSA